MIGCKPPETVRYNPQNLAGLRGFMLVIQEPRGQNDSECHLGLFHEMRKWGRVKFQGYGIGTTVRNLPPTPFLPFISPISISPISNPVPQPIIQELAAMRALFFRCNVLAPSLSVATARQPQRFRVGARRSARALNSELDRQPPDATCICADRQAQSRDLCRRQVRPCLHGIQRSLRNVGRLRLGWLRARARI